MNPASLSRALLVGALVLGSILSVKESMAALPACEDFQNRTFNDPLVNLPYRLYVPPSYDASEKYPLVLVLHGAGESGTDNCVQLTNQSGPLVFVSDTAQAAYPAFMLAPQCPGGQQWVDTPWVDGSYVLGEVPVSKSMTVVLKIIAALQTEFSIDADRLYVTGLSMGGFGTWDIILRHPGMFAAGVPMSGAGAPGSAALIKDVPIWNFHGGSDSFVPTQASRDMVQALRDQGSAVIYSEYPGGHSDWTNQYQTSCLVDWLFRQDRKLAADSGGVSESGECPAGGLAGAGGTGPRGDGGAGGMGGTSPSGAGGSSAGAGAIGGAPNSGGAGGGSGGASSFGGTGAAVAGTAATSPGGANSGGMAPNTAHTNDHESGNGCAIGLPKVPESGAVSWCALGVASAALAKRTRRRI